MELDVANVPDYSSPNLWGLSNPNNNLSQCILMTNGLTPIADLFSRSDSDDMQSVSNSLSQQSLNVSSNYNILPPIGTFTCNSQIASCEFVGIVWCNLLV